MRILLTITFPHVEFNAFVRDGTAGEKLKRILDELKPEAAYFTDHRGERSAYIVLDLPDATKIPAIAEPFFLVFCADVEFKIVMTPDDLANAGLDTLGKKWA